MLRVWFWAARAWSRSDLDHVPSKDLPSAGDKRVLGSLTVRLPLSICTLIRYIRYRACLACVSGDFTIRYKGGL